MAATPPVDMQTIMGNNLLARLRPSEIELIAPYLTAMSAPLGHVLFEPGDDVRHAYFPTASALACFHAQTGDGTSVETAMIGREGAIGGIVSRGRLPAFALSSVMHPGIFLRIESEQLERAKAGSQELCNLFARYADCLVAQVFQSVACNAVHSVEKRAARWLLSAWDRTGSDEFAMTQEQLASILGVGRSYVSRIVAAMKRHGIIATRRGAIRVIDRASLSAISCDCSSFVTEHFETVLAGVYPDPAELKNS